MTHMCWNTNTTEGLWDHLFIWRNACQSKPLTGHCDVTSTLSACRNLIMTHSSSKLRLGQSNLAKKEVNLHLNCPSEWTTSTLMRVRNLMHNGDVDWFTFTFMHLADAFIQSDIQCIQAIHYFFFYRFMSQLQMRAAPFMLQGYKNSWYINRYISIKSLNVN